MRFDWSVLMLFFILRNNFVNAAELVEQDDKFYITGRGCGITTTIKYLTEIPEVLEGHECSIITPSEGPVLSIDFGKSN